MNEKVCFYKKKTITKISKLTTGIFRCHYFMHPSHIKIIPIELFTIYKFGAYRHWYYWAHNER